MKKLLVAALAGLFAAQPASAATVLGDYDVHVEGNAWISGGQSQYGDIASGSFTNNDAPNSHHYKSRVESTQALVDRGRELSTGYAAATPSGTFSTAQYQSGNGILTGLQDGTNVFNITGSQWSQLYALTFSGLGSGAIINISGTGQFTNYVNLNFGSLAPENVVLNFFEASKVGFGGMNVNGSILAPEALVQLNGGNVAGMVVAKSFHGEGANIGGKGFAGFSASIPGGVPEPSTWAMLILGFGAIGAAMRRRAKAGAGLRPAFA